MEDYKIERIDIKEALVQENKFLKNRIKTLESKMDVNYEEYYIYKNGIVDKFFPKKLAKLLINKYNLIYFAGENPYCYKNGVYKESKTVLNSISKYIDDYDSYSVKHTNDTRKEIIFNSLINENKLNPKNIINFRNCLYDINSRETKPHTLDIYSTYQVKANYKPNQIIKDTLFLKFLQNSNCSDKLIDLIRQVIGYCLTSFNEAQKMFILRGKPKTGKSTFLNIIRNLFERQFATSINLEDLQKGEYLALLAGKVINICGDIGQGYIKDTSKILQLLGDEHITVRPLYINPYDISLTAKQIFATNMIPIVNDKTGAFYRRCLVIPWNKQVKEKDTIVNLDKLIVNKEADIIVSWAADSIFDLKNNNFKFKEVKESIIELDEYRLENNSIELFIKNYCIVDFENDKYFITVNEFKNYYKMFCEIENIIPQGYRHLKDFIKNSLGLKDDKQTKYCKSRHYKFIAWNNNITELKIEKQKDLNFNSNANIESYIDNYEELEREGIENES